MRFLVTGVNGFVGQHLVRELTNNNIEVVGVGGANYPTPQITEYKVLDLVKAKEAQTIDFNGIDGVIHLAGLAAVGPSFDKPMEYIATNIGIEVNLFETALAQKATPRFLIISSGSLYAATAALPLSEASLVTPSSPYAVSKLGQETMAQYYIQRGFECIIARPFNHFGPGQGPGFIVPDIAEQVVAVEQGKADTVLVGNLDAQRDYTDVRDITRAYRLLLEKGKSGEIYNICSGTARSGHEVLASILECSTTKPSIQEDPSKMRPADNPVVYADHKKITEDTGWEPEIALDSSIADVMADWRNRS